MFDIDRDWEVVLQSRCLQVDDLYLYRQRTPKWSNSAMFRNYTPTNVWTSNEIYYSQSHSTTY